MASKNSGDNSPTIVIKKIEVVEGGHHGGAWKVAYADFVTAMMAFFLVMWLINATTEQQKRGIADYFAPSNVMGKSATGSGQPFGGKTPFEEGSMASDRGVEAVIEGNATPQPDPANADSDRNAPKPPSRPSEEADKARPGDLANRADAGGGGQAATPAVSPAVRADYLANAGAGTVAKPEPSHIGTADPSTGLSLSKPEPGKPVIAVPGLVPLTAGQVNAAQLAANQAAAAQLADKTLRAELDRREHAAMSAAAQELKAAVASDPALASLAPQLQTELTPEGLRIQILDADKQPMFATGSIELEARAHLLLQKVAGVLMKMTEHISITGHTDGIQYKGGTRTNWELSSERANTTRRLLTEAGLPDNRFTNVAGSADRDPLVPNDPLAAANRRIAIMVLRDAAPR